MAMRPPSGYVATPVSRHPASEQHYVNLSKVIATSFFVVTSSCASLPRFCLDTQRAGTEWNKPGIEWNKPCHVLVSRRPAREWTQLLALMANAFGALNLAPPLWLPVVTVKEVSLSDIRSFCVVKAMHVLIVEYRSAVQQTQEKASHVYCILHS